MTILYFAAGLVFLLAGAEALVRGASRLAARLGVSSLVVGLTVVAFGTSSPELAVAVEAAAGGQAGIAVGNVVGSNIFNVLLVLGLSSLIMPLIVSQQLVRFDVLWMMAVSVLVLLLALDGHLGRVDGLVLVAGLPIYLGFLTVQNRAPRIDADDPEPASERGAGGWWVNVALVLGGLALLVLGSRWLVDGAVAFARSMGVGELVVGLTIVAAGTSLPEVVTSVVAALRGERDIAVGNVVGSNLVNLMGVLGVASLVAPAGIEVSAAVIRFDLPVMIAVAFACLPIFFTGGVISRQEGAVLLAFYVAYTAYLVLAATQHDALPRFSAVMLSFVLPLTLLTLGVVAALEIRAKRSGRAG